MSNELVAFSRAGDVFHYRWAARRCLKLIYPNTSLQSVVGDFGDIDHPIPDQTDHRFRRKLTM